MLPRCIDNDTNNPGGYSDTFAAQVNRRLDVRDRAYERGLAALELRAPGVYPYVTRIARGGDLFPMAHTGLTITGVMLLGGPTDQQAEKATGVSTTGTGKVRFTSVLPGKRSARLNNAITVTIVNSGDPLAVSADASANTIEVVHGDGGASSAAAIVAAVNAHATSKYMVLAAVATAGTVNADDEVLVVSDNADLAYDLCEASIGAIPLDGTVSGCGITSWTDTEITFDVDLSSSGHGDLLPAVLRTGNIQVPGPTIRVSATGKVVSGTVGAESANAIAVPFSLKDLRDTAVASAFTFVAELYTTAGAKVESADATIGISDGTSTLNNQALVIGASGSDGDVTLTVTDASGSFAGTYYLILTPTTSGVSAPPPVALTFA